MAFILLIVVGLVAWALHLMQKAMQHREFSLMLAGFLVSAAAAGMMTVYFLTSHCVTYLSQTSHPGLWSADADAIEWTQAPDHWTSVWADAAPGFEQF